METSTWAWNPAKWPACHTGTSHHWNWEMGVLLGLGLVTRFAEAHENNTLGHPGKILRQDLVPWGDRNSSQCRWIKFVWGGKSKPPHTFSWLGYLEQASGPLPSACFRWELWLQRAETPSTVTGGQKVAPELNQEVCWAEGPRQTVCGLEGGIPPALSPPPQQAVPGESKRHSSCFSNFI